MNSQDSGTSDSAGCDCKGPVVERGGNERRGGGGGGGTWFELGEVGGVVSGRLCYEGAQDSRTRRSCGVGFK